MSGGFSLKMSGGFSLTKDHSRQGKVVALA
jgi:hypothetical protein